MTKVPKYHWDALTTWEICIQINTKHLPIVRLLSNDFKTRFAP